MKALRERFVEAIEKLQEDDENLIDREKDFENDEELKTIEQILKKKDPNYMRLGYRDLKHYDDFKDYLDALYLYTFINKNDVIFEDMVLKKVKTVIFKSDAGYTILKYIDKSLSDEEKENAEKRLSHWLV